MDVLGLAWTLFAIVAGLIAYVSYRKGYEAGCQDGAANAKLLEELEQNVPEKL